MKDYTHLISLIIKKIWNLSIYDLNEWLSSHEIYILKAPPNYIETIKQLWESCIYPATRNDWQKNLEGKEDLAGLRHLNQIGKKREVKIYEALLSLAEKVKAEQRRKRFVTREVEKARKRWKKNNDGTMQALFAKAGIEVAQFDETVARAAAEANWERRQRQNTTPTKTETTPVVKVEETTTTEMTADEAEAASLAEMAQDKKCTVETIGIFEDVLVRIPKEDDKYARTTINTDKNHPQTGELIPEHIFANMRMKGKDGSIVLVNMHYYFPVNTPLSKQCGKRHVGNLEIKKKTMNDGRTYIYGDFYATNHVAKLRLMCYKTEIPTDIYDTTLIPVPNTLGAIGLKELKSHTCSKCGEKFSTGNKIPEGASPLCNTCRNKGRHYYSCSHCQKRFSTANRIPTHVTVKTCPDCRGKNQNKEKKNQYRPKKNQFEFKIGNF